MTGKRLKLKCGHEGEVVIGQYAECETCDDFDEITLEICAHAEFYTAIVERWNPWLGILKEPKDFCVACGAELFDTLGKTKVKF